MDIKQLRYFVEVAESGGFRSASEHLFVSQPPLSRQISALEAEFGFKLFDRHTRGVTLTAEGAGLLDRVREILDKVDQLHDQVKSGEDGLSGIISIGVSESVGSLVARRFGILAEKLREHHPGMKLRMKNGSSFMMMDGLLSGTIDLAVMVDPQPRGGIRSEKLSTQTFYIVGPPNDPRLNRESFSVRDLEGLPLILFDRPSSYRLLIDRAAQHEGVILDVRYEVENSEVIHDVAARGLAYGVLSSTRAFRGRDAGQLSVVKIDGLTLDRMLVVRDGARHPRAVEVVSQIIKAELTILDK